MKMKLTSPIQAFIFASTSIHASLFLMSDSIDLALPGATGSVMSVKLEEQSQNPVEPQAQEIRTKQIKHKNEPTQTSKSIKKTIRQAKEKQAETSSPKKTDAISKARVVSLVYKEINNHFTYPKIAQRRNWQGQVLLAFRLSSNGKIEDIKINHSSGYNVLDQAAITSLKKVGQLPQASSWLFDGMEIQIPIIYQLTQG